MNRPFHLILCFCILISCGPADTDEDIAYEHLGATLALLDQDEARISLPKTPYLVSTAARLAAVDAALASPGQTLFLARSLRDAALKSSDSKQTIDNILGLLNINGSVYNDSLILHENKDVKHVTGYAELDKILVRLDQIADLYKVNAPDVYRNPPAELMDLITGSTANRTDDRDVRWLNTEPVHRAGRASDLNLEAAFLSRYLDIISQLPLDPSDLPEGTWNTPNGRIRISGTGDDHHEGAYMLLIDKGGNDTYTDIHNSVQNSCLIVIDYDGNDKIIWTDTPGPGTGVFGTGIWIDYKGNDIYKGNNNGIGVGIFGAGFFYDAEGNDQYIAGSFTSGAGLYGIGVQIDVSGDDSYISDFSSQGYGSSGGIGILLDNAGNDRYECKAVLADLVKERIERHTGKHYLNMCQGYAFGRRPDYSGGIGLLIDSDGDDIYKADMFAQGGAYWFGLGILIDSSGNDRYISYTHSQGAALHLAAGYLFDYQGDDSYQAYELSQGTGIDRSIGLLFDARGDDHYHSTVDSQAAGIKPFGSGILIDLSGNDEYEAVRHSQAYTWMPDRFPIDQKPIALLVDIGGRNRFTLSKPYVLKDRTFTNNAIAVENQQ